MSSNRLALREKDVLKKAAKSGEIVDDNAVACTTWQAWRKKVDSWRVVQNRLMQGLWSHRSSSEDAELAANAHHTQDHADDEEEDEDYIDVDAPAPSAAASTTGNVATTCSQEVLGLPSDLSSAERQEYQVEVLGEYEHHLRVGQAFDLLDAVRQAVKHLAAYVEEKQEAGHTTKDNMRSADISKFSRAHCQRVAKRYNYVYDRILALRTHPPGKSDPSYHLKPIDLMQDLTITNLKVAREKGDSRRSGSWIWWVFEDAMETTPAQAAKKRRKDKQDKQAAQAKEADEDEDEDEDEDDPLSFRMYGFRSDHRGS